MKVMIFGIAVTLVAFIFMGPIPQFQSVLGIYLSIYPSIYLSFYLSISFFPLSSLFSWDPSPNSCQPLVLIFWHLSISVASLSLPVPARLWYLSIYLSTHLSVNPSSYLSPPYRRLLFSWDPTPSPRIYHYISIHLSIFLSFSSFQSIYLLSLNLILSVNLSVFFLSPSTSDFVNQSICLSWNIFLLIFLYNSQSILTS